MNLINATALETASMVRSRQVSAREVSQAMLAHLERCNPVLNALIHVDPERVLAEADAVDRSVGNGSTSMGSLSGATFSTKDNLWVQGRPASQGSRLFADFVAPASALAVERLQAAGGVALAGSNCSEFACKGNTTNQLHGATRNPWNTTLTPGGSSGGAAAAVAAGIGHLALCTDGGGSTRRPAAHTGVVGFKPSAGAIAHPVGFAEPVFGNSVVGLMARTVEDVAALFDAVAGADPRDPMCMVGALHSPTAGRLQNSLKGRRVAFSPRLGLDVVVDPDVAAATAQAAAWLRSAGADVVQVDPQWPQGTSEDALMPLQFSGLAAIHGEAFRRNPAMFDPDIGAQIERGLSLRGADVASALLHREALYRSLAEFFGRFDLLLTPTTPCVAWPLQDLGPRTIAGQDVSPRAHAAFTPVFNHVYAPACSVPVALDREGLPIGVQLVAPRWHDAAVLQAAWQLQTAAPARFRQPVPFPPALA
ncbi:amidase [Hydrogenophaga sp. IBVHS1]|uniref:amidase n=1 Tax=unclassified Hydrogenophaga TaxID=2610897 RepID=UPI000A2E328F|nr:amidase [Hydrogenophaga sp. IBVHS1]OSZ74870.1 amidase [Hydrogenophaga sp. IBVHS1]